MIVGDADVWRETGATLGIDIPTHVVQQFKDAESRSSTIFSIAASYKVYHLPGS